MKRVSLLPNLITLGNYFCGVLAIAKGIDALTLSGDDPLVFYRKIETAAWLIFLAMFFDMLDGLVARITKTTSSFGAQLDSLSDVVTFGVAPALLAKILIDHEGPLLGFAPNSRLVFFVAGIFAVMAVLRLARFNLEVDSGAEHAPFRGLPSPTAAGSVISFILLYLSLRAPHIETSEGTPTLVGEGLAMFPELRENAAVFWMLPGLTIALPMLGFLMVSRIPYAHLISVLTRKGKFTNVVFWVTCLFVFYMAPVPGMFIAFNGFIVYGFARAVTRRLRRGRGVRKPALLEEEESSEEMAVGNGRAGRQSG